VIRPADYITHWIEESSALRAVSGDPKGQNDSVNRLSRERPEHARGAADAGLSVVAREAFRSAERGVTEDARTFANGMESKGRERKGKEIYVRAASRLVHISDFVNSETWGGFTLNSEPASDGTDNGKI
jgi:hypothetical protein